MVYRYCNDLNFTDTPDYDFLLRLFKTCLQKHGLTNDGICDWHLCQRNQLENTLQKDAFKISISKNGISRANWLRSPSPVVPSAPLAIQGCNLVTPSNEDSSTNGAKTNIPFKQIVKLQKRSQSGIVLNSRVAYYPFYLTRLFVPEYVVGFVWKIQPNFPLSVQKYIQQFTAIIFIIVARYKLYSQ